jgi:hypothetical protein
MRRTILVSYHDNYNVLCVLFCYTLLCSALHVFGLARIKCATLHEHRQRQMGGCQIFNGISLYFYCLSDYRCHVFHLFQKRHRNRTMIAMDMVVRLVAVRIDRSK